MRIDELFDKPAAIKWQTDPNTAYAHFEANGKKYTAKAYLSDDLTSMNFEFFNESAQSKSSSGITGTGDQHTVFATIVEVLRTLIKVYPIENISFTAKEPSRQKLYKTMVRKLLPDWKVTEKIDSWNGPTFNVTKPGAEDENR